ncbi:MAG: methylated-DNA--[protein]-cysteine S-methyltransferase [Planctomycetota bacterium]|nr:methylated-DNA--[protein]-cysteine S-methyltransferase [Planctomycetota bacterium]
MNGGPDAAGPLTARWLPGADGPFLVVKSTQTVVATGWERLGRSVPVGAVEDPLLDENLARRLQNALAGNPEEFADIPLPAGTPFQQACWEKARGIPPGCTLSYGELADSIGHPRAYRAVGQAMRRNPLPIIVPCHRVVRGGGGLGGFSGTSCSGSPGMMIKARLLREEARWRAGIASDL